MMLQTAVRSDTAQGGGQSGLNQTAQDVEDAQEGPIDPNQYVLGAGDQLTLTIFGNEFLSSELSIMPEGGITLPGIGEKRIAGLTLRAAEDTIAKILSPIYRNATVTLSLLRMRHFKVYCSGWVERRTAIMASPMERISDVIERAGGLSQKGIAYLRNIQVTHNNGTTTYVDLYPFYFWGNLASDPHIQDGDVVFATVLDPANLITIYGEVAAPGDYQYSAGDSFSTVIRMAQGLLPSADIDSIEISRFRGDGVSSKDFYVSLADDWRRDNSHFPSDFPVQQGDQFFIRAIPHWHIARTVAIAGEVNYPGRYPIEKDSATLTELVARAKGFTRDADLENAELIRRSTMYVADREFDRLSKMLPSEMSKDESEYFKAKSREHPGLVTVNFTKLFLRQDKREDITLHGDDSVYIPSINNYVTLIGSVNNPGRVAYSSSYTLQDYIAEGGGYGFHADKSDVRALKPRNGEQYDPASSSVKIEPGDSIIVPEEQETNLWPIILQTVQVVTSVVGIFFGVYAITHH